MNANIPKVSVIIPSYNEGTYIDRLLDALALQDHDSFEVIVSDANSKDKTAEVVDSFKNKLDIRLIQNPPNGPAAGRNDGAKIARGQWLLFLDADDDIDDPRFIKTLHEQTEANGWNTSSARMTARGKNAKKFAKLFKYQKILAKTKRPVASGYCIFTSASVFKSASGFNEKIHFGEDYEYVSRTGKNGKFGFVESTCYFVDPRRNEEEKWTLIFRGTLNEIYRLVGGYKKLEKKPIKYEFGKHKERK